MRILILACLSVAILPVLANAQCFNRTACGDPSTMEIHSQISVNVPLADQASAGDTMKTMEDVRRDLYGFSNRECDTLRAIFGGECTLSSVNINSSVQDRGARNRSAFVSISNTYQVKHPTK